MSVYPLQRYCHSAGVLWSVHLPAQYRVHAGCDLMHLPMMSNVFPVWLCLSERVLVGRIQLLLSEYPRS
jgi:hypothetical protein